MFPLRTLLFTPGDDPRKGEKAFAAGADAVILDLEDAVAEAQKERARQQIRQTLSIPRPVPVFVRINGASSPHILPDLQTVVDLPVEGLMLAKAESGEEVRRVDWLLSLLEQQHQLPVGKIKIIPFVESARGISRAGEIAAAPRVSCLAFGGNDYTMDIGVPYSRDGEELFFARSQLVVASRAAGIAPPLDTVNPDFRDISFLVEDARRARKLGFQGKLVIHPAQVAPVNEVFTPGDEEIAWAEKVVEAFARAQAAGSGVIQVEGKMVELPIVRRAEQLLAAARRLGKKQ
ncbi:CoA ester lyase [Desulfofundulus sp. TPOSR]|jgi:citrate lyase subunit beta/citryl-CoA lyase|uniref:Citryl-CoA lyase n=1 Tax=Desulfofundulus kuznetsovii (strain DSM 6115 / VKM B-1805 / 17) TaxID=760568 RepID=A0AAU8PDS8_DESK7|nr:CoA ester lyase [Desulfofundulus sp. TPOSR]AEG16261.1 Citryl-CoA lyase [Desulfofundulus kuznetsovii DSM 6115]NHM27240.1 CoA ester lyase [Desulfofundulus sp. TPOSR]